MRESLLTYEAWLDQNPAPELDELIARYDTLSRVPPDEWIIYDRRFRSWNNYRITRHWE
ncbi:MAG TPA: hypothetical protein VHT52_16215 [Stellaceae bacterium]|jgi:hypothetical protein|nr:hypothetical protein [Stellaceae bacterium]